MLCHLLQFPRKGVNIQKRPQRAVMKPHNFQALSKNKWFVLILGGSLENYPRCNLVDNKAPTKFFRKPHLLLWRVKFNQKYLRRDFTTTRFYCDRDLLRQIFTTTDFTAARPNFHFWLRNFLWTFNSTYFYLDNHSLEFNGISPRHTFGCDQLPLQQAHI